MVTERLLRVTVLEGKDLTKPESRRGYTKICPWVAIETLEKKPANQYRNAVLESSKVLNSQIELGTGKLNIT
jgi:hypothetical protein